MCRCGRSRALAAPPPYPFSAAAQSALPRPLQPSPPAAAAAAPRKPSFEYVGATALTVVGPASGLRYRFDRPGARLVVDPRDRVALQAVPHLRLHGAFRPTDL